MKKKFKILSPCGILGYGYPKDSFMAGIDEKPDAIVVDAGSTDAGPHKLGAGTAIVSREAYKRDLEIMIVNGDKLKIPVIVGSAGGSGGKKHVDWTISILQEILKENDIKKKVAIIWADIPKEVVRKSLSEKKLVPLGLSVKELTEERLNETNGIVAQMGHEPIIEALKKGAEIIICGRSYDPSPFAAVAIYNGFDEALSYHLGKILECAALCAEPGSAKDCMMGIVEEDSFTVKPLNPKRRCTSVSVAAHTFYEKSHPYILLGPGIISNLEHCSFKENKDGSVTVRGSKISHTDIYRIKLEGARLAAYRAFVVAGVRDPILISKIEEVEEAVKKEVSEHYKEAGEFSINFMNYGLNGVLGEIEPNKTPGHELGIVFEVLAHTQEVANMVLATVRSTFLHYGYEGRKSTAGNLAFPFAPSDIPFGPVYEFSVYHLMDVKDGLKMFPITFIEEVANETI